MFETRVTLSGRGKGPVETTKVGETGGDEGKAEAATQESLKSAIFRMSRGMTAVSEALGAGKGTMPEYNPLINTDPQFNDWDGNPNTLASSILDATYRVETRGTSDAAAIRFAKLKLSAFLKSSTLHCV